MTGLRAFLVLVALLAGGAVLAWIVRRRPVSGTQALFLSLLPIAGVILLRVFC
jgi:hypothetical protein